jgi:hypothetical protein
VQLLPDPPTKAGAIVQLGERLLCKQEVAGSIPAGSTSSGGRQNCSGIHTGAMLRLLFTGREADREQSFDRTVSMKPCCSLTIWKILCFDAKFSSEIFCFVFIA